MNGDPLFAPEPPLDARPKYIKIEVKPPVNSIEKAQKKKIILVPVDGGTNGVAPDPLFS
jgi:hypothetical protein